MEIGNYTGGSFVTHAYWLEAGNGHDGVILFDAPEGIVGALEAAGIEKVAALVLTHGHFDHIWDAAAVAKKYDCPVYIHPDDVQMIEDPSIFKPWIGVSLEPVTKHQLIELPEQGAGEFTVAGRTFQAAHVPGHCPGSVTFYDEREKLVIAGDTLFAGGIGRWDLPGGSLELLVEGIRKHLFPLPDATRVYPGHGPATTIGEEKLTNTFLLE